jgi:hypothetical protein
MAWDRRACRSDHMDEYGRRARVKSANATTRSRQTIKLLLGPAWPVRNVTSNAAPAEKRGSSNVRRGLANLYISYNSAVYKIKVKLLFHKLWVNLAAQETAGEAERVRRRGCKSSIFTSLSHAGKIVWDQGSNCSDATVPPMPPVG